MSHRIAIVTSGPGRPFDDDLPPLVAALEQVGATVEVLDWDDDGADWGSFDLAVIRSTWDYTQRHDEFLDWTRRCASATTLINAPAVVAWNSDKRYLRDLVDAGVNVVDTSFIEPGDAIELPVGVEFVTAGISSASLKALVANLTASAPYLAPIVNYVVDDADNTLKASNAHLRYSQANANGLSLVTVSATEVNVTFLALAGDVLKPDYAGIASRQQFRTRVGTNKIEVL